MKFRHIATSMSLVATAALFGPAASAQPLGGVTGGAAASAQRTQAQLKQRVQARAQQRVQARTQQRVQTQVQQRAQGQVQARLQQRMQQRAQDRVTGRIQANATRVANLAERAVEVARRQQAAIGQRAESGVGVGVGAGVNSKQQAHFGQNRAAAKADMRVALRAGAGLPAGLTEADVAAYDEVFGRFNPLRRGGENRSEQQANQQKSHPTASGQKAADAEDSGNASGHSRRGGLGAAVAGNLDFAARLQAAIGGRRAQISQMRDRAIATGNAQLLTVADTMEQRLDAFVEAKTRAERGNRGVAHGRGRAAARATTEADGQTQSSLRSNLQGSAASETSGAAAPRPNGTNSLEGAVDGSASGEAAGEANLGAF